MTEEHNMPLMDGIEPAHEDCDVINEIEENSPTPRASFVGPVQDAPGCATKVANTLSQQSIHEVNVILEEATGHSSDLLVSFDRLNVQLGSAAYPYLQPAALEALRNAIQDRGSTMVVNSAYRTLAQQFLLYTWKHNGTCNFRVVAPPGASYHQAGLAIDIADHLGWRLYLERHGWEWFGNGDKPHFTYKGSNRVLSINVNGRSFDIRNIATLAFQRLWNRNNPSHPIAEDGDYGRITMSKLMLSPANGFEIAPWDQKPRMLRLSTPLLEGSDIERIQTALQRSGLLVGVDGVFGSHTEQAVKQFQQQTGLVVDGVVGPNTLAMMSQVTMP
ncbi:MAG: peptidoglycan-binding protein [Thainema sp.]